MGCFFAKEKPRCTLEEENTKQKKRIVNLETSNNYIRDHLSKLSTYKSQLRTTEINGNIRVALDKKVNALHIEVGGEDQAVEIYECKRIRQKLGDAIPPPDKMEETNTAQLECGFRELNLKTMQIESVLKDRLNMLEKMKTQYEYIRDFKDICVATEKLGRKIDELTKNSEDLTPNGGISQDELIKLREDSILLKRRHCKFVNSLTQDNMTYHTRISFSTPKFGITNAIQATFEKQQNEYTQLNLKYWELKRRI